MFALRMSFNLLNAQRLGLDESAFALAVTDCSHKLLDDVHGFGDWSFLRLLAESSRVARLLM